MEVTEVEPLPRGPARRIANKRAFVGGGIFLGVLAVFLSQTRLPAVLEKAPTLDREASGGGRSTFSQVLDPASYPEGLSWVAYGVNLWDANAVGMFFAIVLGGAAVTALSPAVRLKALVGRRGPLAAGVGGGMGVPLFMCSACSAPVSLGFYRAGARLEATLGMILGSALFNPVGILAIFLLMPINMGVARVGCGLLMIFAVVPAIARLRDRRGGSCSPEDAEAALSGAARSIEHSLETPARESWGAAVKDGVVEWWRATLDHMVRLVPVMALATFAVGAVFVFAPPQELSDAVGSVVVATVAAAALGTLIQLPTLFEIPLVLGVLALGVDVGPATALLLTAPSAGVVTLAVTRKELGWGPPGLLLVATFVVGALGGIVVGAL
ncbi:MAG TPA: permease [Solirubrobacteraceae bacterium]|nr:permease [Solirubrobacteraceae bacterium]